jgi:hypothetical protein
VTVSFNRQAFQGFARQVVDLFDRPIAGVVARRLIDLIDRPVVAILVRYVVDLFVGPGLVIRARRLFDLLDRLFAWLFGYFSARDRSHLTHLSQSWRTIRRVGTRPYDGPRVARAWEEVQDLSSWPRVAKLSRTERLVLSGSVVPGVPAPRTHAINLNALPILAISVVALGIFLLFGGRFGPALGAQAALAWSALKDSSQAPSQRAPSGTAPAGAPLATATSSPTRSPTPEPTVITLGSNIPTRTPTITPTPTISPTPTITPTPTPPGVRANAIIEGIIRAQPHQNGPRVGRLPLGANVEALRVVRGGAPFPPEDRWVEIKYGDLQGYVYWSLLDRRPE